MALLRLTPSFTLTRFEIFNDSMERLLLIRQYANKCEPELPSTCPLHGCLLDPHGPIKPRHVEAHLKRGACWDTDITFNPTTSL